MGTSDWGEKGVGVFGRPFAWGTEVEGGLDVSDSICFRGIGFCSWRAKAVDEGIAASICFPTPSDLQ